MLRLLLILLALLIPSVAYGQQQPACGPRDQVANGATDGGAMLEVYASESGSWTLTLTQGDVSCIAATGQAWNFVFTAPKGRGA